MKLTFKSPNLGSKTTQETIDFILESGKSVVEIIEPFFKLLKKDVKTVKALEQAGEKFRNYLSKSRDFKKIL